MTIIVSLLGLSLFVAVFFWRHETRAKWIVAAGMSSVLILSLPLSTKLLIYPLHKSVHESSGETAPTGSWLLVPTGGVYSDGVDRWWPKPISVSRMALGVQLQKASQLPLAVIGGVGRDDGPAEAPVLVAAFGLRQSEMLYVDDQAPNTFETARALRRIVASDAPATVIIATSCEHYARTAASLRQFNFVARRPKSACASFDHFEVRDLLPSVRALSQLDSIFHEYGGIVTYWLRGWISWRDLME